MKDIFEQNSIRPNGQLLDPTAAVPNGHRSAEKEVGRKINDELEVRREAEGMIHYLLAQSKKPAILIESHWSSPGEAYAFEKEPIFREVAHAAGCVTHLQTCPDQGGTRHLFFIGRNAKVADSEYLECLPASLPHLC